MDTNIDAILSLVSSLTPPEKQTANEVFSAARLPKLPDFHVAVDSAANLAMLIASIQSNTLPAAPPVVLRGISIRFDVPCQLHFSDRRKDEGTFTIVTCRSGDPADRELFLRIMVAFAQMVGAEPDARMIRISLDQLLQLFRSLESPAETTVQGLWAELFIIHVAQNPRLLLSAWHKSAHELWDFSADGQHLEVKSSTDQGRIHHFSLRQLQPPPSERLLIASLSVYRSGSGYTVADLLHMLSKQHESQPKYMFKAEQVIASSLGATWREASIDRFSVDRAKDTLRYFASDSVPSICPSTIPPEISDVRFRADLSNCQCLNRDARRRFGGLFAILGGW